MPEKKPFARLPLNVVPSNYNVVLTPDLEKFTFSGELAVTVQVNEPTNKIILNSAEIEIQAVSFSTATEKLTGKPEFDSEAETVSLLFPSTLPAGSGTLNISYTGCHNDKMKGFYRTQYKTPSGETRHAAVTQFESTDARRALPCWDEPAIKATFDVTLVVPKDRVALSNMPVTSDTEEGSLRRVSFQRTPIMSTYLLAFVVGEYDFVEARDADGVLIRVYTPLDKKQQGEFALQVAVKTLPFYKEYFGIAYPLPKMDLIAIADFAAGAMENWGLVTYRETALLIDPANSSSSTKQWVALVVGHELAHQWFGNLVTMEWWTHLWLNEGFASFIEYLCVDHCFPEFDIWTQFVSQDLSRALDLDALNNSHPIEVPVGHPAEVDEIFDLISYSKGASVIRMLHSWIGDKAFRAGMNSYLTKFAYKNALTEDLWDALGAASGQPVREVMSTWTSQMGFPVIQVEEEQKGSSRLLTLTQSKFCADGKAPEGDYQWMVPISVVTQASPDTPVLSSVLSDRTTTITVENVQPGQWVKLNPGAMGVYRVRYSASTLDQLVSAVSSLPSRDRLMLQNDLFALSRAGLSSSSDVLKVLQAYRGELDYTVWQDITSNLSSIAVITQYTDYSAQFDRFLVQLYSGVAEKLGWVKQDGESPLSSMLRALVLSRLGKAGHSGTVSEAVQRLDAHLANSEVLDADLRAAVYSTVLKHGPAEYFDKLMKLYADSEMSEERVRILRVLGSVQDAERLQKVLDFSISESVRSQDAVFCIAGVTGSAQGRALSWKFVKENWTKINQMFDGGFLLARLVKLTTEDFADASMIPEIKDFFEKNPAPSAERTVQQSCENITLNAAMLDRDRQSLGEYLKSFDQ